MTMSYPRPNESEFPEGWGWEMEKGARTCIRAPVDLVSLSSLFSFLPFVIHLKITVLMYVPYFNYQEAAVIMIDSSIYNVPDTDLKV